MKGKTLSLYDEVSNHSVVQGSFLFVSGSYSLCLSILTVNIIMHFLQLLFCESSVLHSWILYDSSDFVLLVEFSLCEFWLLFLVWFLFGVFFSNRRKMISKRLISGRSKVWVSTKLASTYSTVIYNLKDGQRLVYRGRWVSQVWGHVGLAFLLCL